MKPTVAVVVVLTTGACVPQVAADGAALLVPEDVELHWDDSYNAVEDDLGALVPVDVMVYDPNTGEPLESEVFQLRGAGVRFVTADEDVLFDPNPCGPPCVWDAYRDQYVEVDVRMGRDSAESSVILSTDELGLGRVHVFVDAFPEEGDGFSAIPVHVSLGGVVDTFFIIPR